MHTSRWLGSSVCVFLLLLVPLFAAPPVLQRADALGFVEGDAVEYHVVATGATAYTAVGLPPGTTIDASTGVIRGVARDVGRYPVTVSATNADGTSSVRLDISVVSSAAGPLIYAPLMFDAYHSVQPGGEAFTCTLKATGSPTSYETSEVLPAGWSFSAGGVLVGRTQQPGLSVIPVSATNANGIGSAAITVRVHPACTQFEQTTGSLQAGDVFRVALQFNRPVSFGGDAPYLEFTTYPSGATRRLAYASGNGTSALTFTYTVTADDTPGDILLYTTLQPSAGAEVIGLQDQDGLQVGKALPIAGAYTPVARIVVVTPTTPTPTGNDSGGQGSGGVTTPTPSVDPVVTTPPASTPDPEPMPEPTPTTPPVATTPPPTTTPVVTAPPASTPTTPDTPTMPAPQGRLVNLSARALVAEGDANRAFLAGFVVSGATPRSMLLRAVGPALTALGVTSPVANPRLRVYDAAGTVIAENDDWNTAEVAAKAASVGAFSLKAGSTDAARVLTLAPGLYTMEVVPGSGAGVALAEVYDLGTGATEAPLVNISTRAYVGAGEGALTAGFVIGGNAAKRVLVRGVGPGLSQLGVSGVLADPKLAVYRAGGVVVAENNDWQSGTAAADVAAASKATGAFALTPGGRDAATVLTLEPGAYTVVVSSVDGGAGTGLVEVYQY
ncbi:putative Ig domain-containing protein [Opitutus sp. ER46]|uniref:putative Ig domain-containing protein n=1 Tax=Opitutus sp. ER46 TaxID=2161864 RepID=UPI000D3001B4|nr:putative Ig domain-containing protein [Opitutus sp. ER46]PTX91180.1 hypothetical protein DB354_21350 [Opitutus sp. ER46]